jgi:drug/metabolite transporter (DMT)-like permease
MAKWIAFAIGACFVWGLIFVIPQFLEGFSAIEVAIGRYLFYGMISLLIFCGIRLKGGGRFPLSIWFKASYYSLVCTVGYYTFVVLGLRYADPAICTLVLGISPITITFYGNWKERECSFKSLILPSLLILFGLVITNTPQLMESTSPTSYLLGLCCCFWALLGWSWYAVANARFLKDHPEIAPSDWSTLIGVATLCWVGMLSLFLVFISEEQFNFEKYTTLDANLHRFLGGCAVLGLLCSWVGGFLWNRATVNLPVSLAGQLMVFETIFGLLFVYLADQEFPPIYECVGISFFLVAIFYGIRASLSASQQNAREVV